MTGARAIAAPRIFDGEAWHEDAALLIDGDSVSGIVARGKLPDGVEADEIADGLLAPGFVDLQVNGGGGVMLNDRRDVEAIRTICAVHARFGTTALLATLITDTPEITAEAIEAGAQATRQDVPGFLGLHLEGPHLSMTRKGAHDPQLIRPMTDADLHVLVAARDRLPVLLSTVAAESVTPTQVAAMSRAGVVVSIGHSDTSFAGASALQRAGATMATHLFNAMSQIGSREPGLAGAAISSGGIWAGLIADGIHVDPMTIGIALRAKAPPGRIFLVTDAMATIGTDMTEFKLNGRAIYRRNGSLRLADGTLAGADLDMISAVRFMHTAVGVGLDEALRMASLYPAQAIGEDRRYGRLRKGSRADVIHLTDGLDVAATWIGGKRHQHSVNISA